MFGKWAENKKSSKLDISVIILGVLVLAAMAATLEKGGWDMFVSALAGAGELFENVWLLLLLGFVLGGMIQVLIPQNLINRWIGPKSGIKGILIASYISIFISGNPYVWLPVVASVYRAGAGVGPIMALLTARAILSLQMLIVWQIPFFGMELPLARFIVCLFIPPVVGLAGDAIYRIAGWPLQAASIKYDNSSPEQTDSTKNI